MKSFFLLAASALLATAYAAPKPYGDEEYDEEDGDNIVTYGDGMGNGVTVSNEDIEFLKQLRAKINLKSDGIDVQGKLSAGGLPIKAQNTGLGDWGILRNGAAGSLCLDSGHTKNGDPIFVWPCFGHVNQQWRFDGNLIRHQLSNRCLDVPGGNLDGAPILWDCHHENPNQRFEFKDGEIIHLASGRRITLPSTAPGKVEFRLSFAPEDRSLNQRWSRL